VFDGVYVGHMVSLVSSTPVKSAIYASSLYNTQPIVA
jgi:hypothetical protein